MHPATTPPRTIRTAGAPAGPLVACMCPACALFAPCQAGASMPKLTTLFSPEPSLRAPCERKAGTKQPRFAVGEVE
jgi:hypothetical protein